ncbi:unnamed protein product [Urochloa humidicola]
MSAFLFLVDLVHHVDAPLVDFVRVNSNSGGTQSSGKPWITVDLMVTRARTDCSRRRWSPLTRGRLDLDAHQPREHQSASSDTQRLCFCKISTISCIWR